MNFQAIQATTNDALDLGLIHSCSWKAAYKGIIPDEIIDRFTPEIRANAFRDAISINPEEYYIFKQNNCPVGFASLYKSHETGCHNELGEIYSIYFHPDFWGNPITQWGLNFCINRLAALGYSEISVWVLEDNIRARKFYEKNGFFFDGHTQEIFIGKNLKEIRYLKKLRKANEL